MEYLNDRKYSKGDAIELTITVDVDDATTSDGKLYTETLADFLSKSGHPLRLWGSAPEVEGDKAIIVLTGRMEEVNGGDYRNVGGIQGRVPGGTVKHKKIVGLVAPLGVNPEPIDL